MSKDIREIMKNYKNENVSLSANHRANFQDRLLKEVHPPLKNNNIFGYRTTFYFIKLLTNSDFLFP